MAEIVFILEPDMGRLTIESSQAESKIAKELTRDLGQGTSLNCARPKFEFEKSGVKIPSQSAEPALSNESAYVYRIYHHSTVDGPGRRSVIQFAGCSIRCAGCYVAETHERGNGKLVSITEIVVEVEKRRNEHDGVTILGGEPFDQPESLQALVENLKAKGYHLVIYSGYTLENLLDRKSIIVNQILARTDLLIDGAFRREFTERAGEYRGSSNQRLIFHPITRQKKRAVSKNS